VAAAVGWTRHERHGHAGQPSHADTSRGDTSGGSRRRVDATRTTRLVGARLGSAVGDDRRSPGYDRRVRYPVVLFDLDGTVIDSGAIILASMRHAAETVVGGSWSDGELMKAVGGPGLEAQMVALDPQRVDELVRVYRAHNEPLHDTLECCAGMDAALAALKERGHRLGIVTAKRRSTVDLAFARLPLEHFFETIVGGDETERHKPDPAPLLLALERLGATPGETAYVGDSPFDMQAAKAGGLAAIGVSWGRIHTADRLVDADVVVDSAEELLGVV
jgi:pyrophosphatase PpaX